MKTRQLHQSLAPSLRMANLRQQNGFSLIELMVAMLIGSVVMLGVFNTFVSTKNSAKMLEAEATLQENARFAFSVMNSVLQQAGNFGCQTSNDLTTRSIVDTTDETFRPWRVIEGWEAKNTGLGDDYSPVIGSTVKSSANKHWQTTADTVIDKGTRAKPGSDILKVWYTKSETVPVDDLTGGVLSFPPIDLEKGDILAINDCQQVVFAQACQCEDKSCSGNDTQADISQGACYTPGNTLFDFSVLNIPTAELSVLEQAIFFVGKRGNDKNNMPSLFVRYLGKKAKPGQKVEIMEGVESLQVLYGEDTDNDQSPNYYVSAADVSNWRRVVSLKISLLLRSQENNLVERTNKVEFHGGTVKPSDTDRYLRRVFSSTVSLRNRNIGF